MEVNDVFGRSREPASTETGKGKAADFCLQRQNEDEGRSRNQIQLQEPQGEEGLPESLPSSTSLFGY